MTMMTTMMAHVTILTIMMIHGDDDSHDDTCNGNNDHDGTCHDDDDVHDDTCDDNDDHDDTWR